MASTPERDPRAVLLDCLTDPGNAADRLPYLMSLLDGEDRALRVGAAWACCLVAVETDDPEVVEYLVRRLADRLSGAPPIEVTQALDYLAARHPGHVETILDAGSDGGRTLPEVGAFTRDHYYGEGSATDREGSGRARIPEGGEDDPRRTYAGREAGQDERADHGHDGAEGDGEAAEADDDEGESEPGDDGAEAGSERQRMLGRTDTLSAVAARSRFDDLHIVGAQSSGRYADTYQALVGRDGEEQAVAVRLLRRPEEVGARPDFAADVGARLREWAGAGGEPTVVSVLDWGADPRPWAAVSFTRGALAERGALDPTAAAEDARALAAGVSALHQRGIVHGGIDPKNVAYPGRLMGEDGVGTPMLDNVGLMRTFRHYFEPALCLSPRYAAPEYFDDRFGRIDHATDVYGLGAVLYRLFAGRPPYTGSFREVRQGVLAEEVPRPGEVTAVPPGIDEVVGKAMATQKIARYETVEHMGRELASIDG